MEFPNQFRYSKDHEWSYYDGNVVTVGLTTFAVEQLGDITLVCIDVKRGDFIDKSRTIGTIESVKSIANLYSPITGIVKEINDSLMEHPELVNDDPYSAWLIKVEPSDIIEYDNLLDHLTYKNFLRA